jgi:hypothetical protein
MNNQPAKSYEDFTNTIQVKVTRDIEDLKMGDVAYISPNRAAKQGDIVLYGTTKAELLLSVFNNQNDIIGTVTGRYRSVTH